MAGEALRPCPSCIFFHAATETCRYRSPALVGSAEGPVGAWPPPPDRDGCADGVSYEELTARDDEAAGS